MTRATAVAILATFKVKGRVTPKQLSMETNVEESSIREWLYALRAGGLVEVTEKRTQVGKSSGRSTQYWKLTL